MSLFSNIGALVPDYTTYEKNLMPVNSDTYPYAPAPAYDPFYVTPTNLQTDEPLQQDNPTPNDYIAISKGTEITLLGVIYDAETKLAIDKVTVQFYDSNGKKTGDPLLEDIGGYSAYIPDGSDIAGIVFSAKGYKEKRVSLSVLAATPDVYLSKSNIEVWVLVAVAAAVLVYRKQTGKVGKIEKSDVQTILLLVGGTIGIVLLIKALRALGILGGGNVTNEQTDSNSPWKPAYYHQFTTFNYALTTSQAKDFASTIYNAFGVFQDDYNAILGVFSQLRTKSEASFLAEVFQNEYDTDLLGFLTDGGGILPWDGLSTTHMDTLISLVKKLPTN